MLLLRRVRPRGGKQTRVRVFPGIISARKVFYEDIPACASLEPAEKGGTNTGLGEAVKSHKSAGPSAALDRGYAARISVDGFAQVEKMCSGAGQCSRRGCASGGGGEHSGANAHAAGCLAVPGPSAFSMKNRLVQYLVSMSCALPVGPLQTAYIINFCG